MDKRLVISFGVSLGSYAEFVERIVALGLVHESADVCVANVHMCIEAWLDRDFAAIVNRADIVTPDGMPLVKALKFLHGIRQDRVAGMDLMPDLLAYAEKNQASVYLYGSTQEVLDAIAGRIAREYPDLELAGRHSPPFRLLSKEEEKEDINRINNSDANIVLVALGCPKQEQWMARNKGKVKAVMVGIGGAFPVFAGLQKRAPKWMCDCSLEWLFRLLQEPRRLFKRYFVTNSLFLLLLAWELCRKPFRSTA